MGGKVQNKIITKRKSPIQCHKNLQHVVSPACLASAIIIDTSKGSLHITPKILGEIQKIYSSSLTGVTEP